MRGSSVLRLIVPDVPEAKLMRLGTPALTFPAGAPEELAFKIALRRDVVPEDPGASVPSELTTGSSNVSTVYVLSASRAKGASVITQPITTVLPFKSFLKCRILAFVE